MELEVQLLIFQFYNFNLDRSIKDYYTLALFLKLTLKCNVSLQFALKYADLAQAYTQTTEREVS